MFVFSVCRLVSRRCHNISTIPRLSAAPHRTVLALLTHTAPHMCHSRAVFGRAMRCNFVSTDSPRLCAGGVSSHRPALCCLLSSGGVTRHLRYYETIRLPMSVSSSSPITVVGTLSHPWKRTWGLPGCRAVSLSCMPWSQTPGRGCSQASCGCIRVGFR